MSVYKLIHVAAFGAIVLGIIPYIWWVTEGHWKFRAWRIRRWYAKRNKRNNITY